MQNVSKTLVTDFGALPLDIEEAISIHWVRK